MGEKLGRYILDKKIAEGGMAEVYLARQSGPGGYERVCVVKRMLPEVADDHVMVQMFLDEARLAAQLNHPHIALIYDFGQQGDTFFLAMEHVPGCSLRDLIDEQLRRRSYLPFPVVARMISDIAGALDYAYGAISTTGAPLKVIHRDVTPHNILLSSSGVVKLIDFGIAKASSARQRTHVGTIKGKWAYMSPEQIRGEPLDNRTDLYSLGLVLYELLTNTRAFDGISDQALLEAVYLARFVPPSLIRPEIPVRLLEILGRCVGKELSSRYGNGGEMAAALDRYILETGEPVPSRYLAALVPRFREKTPSKPKKAPPPRAAQPLGGGAEQPTDKAPQLVEPKSGRGASEAITLPPQPPSPRRSLTPSQAPTLAPGQALPLRPHPLPRRMAPLASVVSRTGASLKAMRSSLRRRAVAWSVGGLVAGLVAAGTYWALARHGTRVSFGRGRSSVAVLPFQNLAERTEADWLSTALSELLGTELGSSGGIRVIPGENVARARSELGLSDSLEPSAESLGRLKADLGSDLVVTGAFVALGDKSGGQLQVDVKLRRTSDGDALASFRESGTEGELGVVVSRLGQRLRAQLGLPEPSATEAVPAYRGSPEGTRLYAEGLAQLRRYELLGARATLEKAVEASPENPLAWAALSAVWSQLGSDAKAAEMAKKALERSDRLGREDRLAIEARDHEMSHSWTAAQGAYASLWTFFPDDVEYGLGLIRVQYKGGDAKGALATVERIHGDDPRLELEAARAAIQVSDYQAAYGHAGHAVARAQLTGSKALEAQALLEQSWATSFLGDNAHAVEGLERAKRLCESLGDKACVAHALDWEGAVYNDLGDPVTATLRLEAAVAQAKAVGDGATLESSLNNLALVEYGQGHLARAHELMTEAIQIAKDLDMRRALASLKDTLARVLDAQAEGGAEKLEREAESGYQEIGDPGGEAITLICLGAMALDRAELTAAQGSLQKGIAVVRERSLKTYLAEGLRASSELLEEQDEPAGALKLLDEERPVLETLGEKAHLAGNAVAHARLLLAAGKPKEAAQLAEPAVRTLRAQHALDDEVAAGVVLSAARRTGRDYAAAQEALDAVGDSARSSENPRSRIRWGIEWARVAARQGKAQAGLEKLEPLIAEAQKAGLVRLELEARLAQGEIELQSGQRKRALAHLQAANKDAVEHGLLRLARLSQVLGRG